jgi:Na+/phosphate symporter
MRSGGFAMKEKSVFFNPFRIISPGLNAGALRLKDLHTRPVSEPIPLQEGLLVMSSKVIEMIELLSKSVVTGAQKQMTACESLAQEVHQQEKVLTTDLVSSKLRPDLLNGLIRFPYRIERIGDMLEAILNCCRIKAQDGIPFTDKAYEELDQLFAFLSEMTTNLRDAFVTPNKILLEHIMSDSKKLDQMLLDFRFAHWRRLEGGFCSPRSSSTYLAILDSIAAINEYLKKMSATLLELGTTSSSGNQALKKTKRKSA